MAGGHGGGGAWFTRPSESDERYLERAREAQRERDIREAEERRKRYYINDRLKPSLEHLQLGSAQWLPLETCQWDWVNITNDDIRVIATECLQLKTLRLSHLKQLTQIASGIFIKSAVDFPRLEFLHVSNCPQLDIFKVGAPLLQKLEVYDNAALRAIQVRAQFSAQVEVRSPHPKLEVERNSLEDSDLIKLQDTPIVSLDLSYCDKITPMGLACLVSMPLKKLSLRECRKQTLSTISQITGDEPSSLSQNLESLDLGGVLAISENSVELSRPLRWHCFNLTQLDLSDNLELTSEYLFSLFHLMKNLISLSVSNCPKLTDKVFISFPYLSSLTEVRADHLPLLTDEGVEKLNQRAPIKLSIAKCKQVTDAGLKALEKSKALRMLNVKQCPLVTLRAVLSLQKAIPGIQILHDLDSTTH